MQISPRFTTPFFVTNGIPKINWSHPITNGLKGVWMPGLAQFNLVTGAAMILQGTSSKTPLASPYGSSFLMNGALGNTGFKTSDPPFIAKSGGVNWSIFSLHQRTASGTSQGLTLYGERGSSGNDIIKFDFNDSGTCDAEITLRNDAATFLQVRTATYDGLWHAWLGTKNGNGGSGNVIIYRDGLVDNTGNWTGTDSYTDATLAGGVFNDLQDTSAANVNLAIVAAWVRVLSPDEAFQLATDPFCYLLSNEDYVGATLVGVAAAGGVVFRKTLSSIGTRTGSRQVQG